MQATGSLTPQQQATLTAVYHILRGTSLMLRLFAEEQSGGVRDTLESTIHIFEKYETILLEQFPDAIKKHGGAQ